LIKIVLTNTFASVDWIALILRYIRSKYTEFKAGNMFFVRSYV